MRKLILLITGLIGAVFAVTYLAMPALLEAPSHHSTQGEALIGGNFSLVDQNGKPFTQQQMLGHYSLVLFGFTHCPDVCPTSLLIIANSLKELGIDAKKITPIFITVDPERDTPETLKLYVSNFYPTLVGLSGNAEQIKQAANAYKVFYSKVEQPDSALGYVMDHSTYIYLMGKDGKYITHFPHNVAQPLLTDTLKRTINP